MTKLGFYFGFGPASRFGTALFGSYPEALEGPEDYPIVLTSERGRSPSQVLWELSKSLRLPTTDAREFEALFPPSLRKVVGNALKKDGKANEKAQLIYCFKHKKVMAHLGGCTGHNNKTTPGYCPAFFAVYNRDLSG